MKTSSIIHGLIEAAKANRRYTLCMGTLIGAVATFDYVFLIA